MSNEMIVGIDLGTTNSEVAAWHAGKVQVLEEGGTALFPSVVGLAADGEMLVGEPARNQYVLYPARTVKSVKRLMGSGESIILDGRAFSPQELSGLILRALKQRAERILGVPVGKAVVTVPAYFSDAQRQATRDAGRIAGLDVVRMIHEPTAAVLAYEGGEAMLQALDPEKTAASQTVMIYDLGGGTLDVSIVQVHGDVTEVLASHGDTHLGGDDFDLLVYENILVFMREKLGVAVVGDDRALKNRLLRAAEEAKKRLSFEEKTVIREEYVGTKSGLPIHLEMELSRARFEELARPLLDRSLQSVQKALEGAARQPANIDRILLVGGSTRIPLVSTLLEQTMGQKPRKDIHPDLCVAQGAGVMAARMMGHEIEKVLVDVTPYTFGTSALGELGGSLSVDKFVPIIHRNSPLPCSKSEEFFTACDFQEQVDVKIYQGEEADARWNILVGRFLISGLSQVPEGNPISMRMDLDINGILHVTARETRTGLEKTVKIDNAFCAMNELQLEASRQRMKAADDDPLNRAFSGLGVAAVANAGGEEEEMEISDASIASAVQAASASVVVNSEPQGAGIPAAKMAAARVLIEKTRGMMERMHDDDRNEAGQLMKAVEDAIASQNEARLNDCVEELGEILFFVEEKV